ncbi:MAG: peptidyl-prolyl cis-trans isomerase, partial [Rhodothermales bacterium]|nr:peptidyl-prolyl cis-trans isomerase [Rhodothermales bacterium]
VINTREGRTTPVIEDRGLYHIVQVVERVPAGTLPKRQWIEASLRQQLQVESRKLLYARLVQRLRNEALAREQLQIR